MRASAGFGRIERWDDARGFGFIAPEAPVAGAPHRLFVHVRDCDRTTRPGVGARVRFVPERQSDGRWRAVRVAAVGMPASTGVRAMPPQRTASTAAPAAGLRGLWIAVAVWVGLLAAALMSGRLPPLAALAALAALNALTFAAFALDKRAAQQNRWRTPEAHLHLLELLGGWPASAFAQQTLRHKRAKPAYLKVFGAMITLHLLVLGLWTFA